MKYVLGTVVVLVVLGGGWYLWNQSAAPSDTESVTAEMHEEMDDTEPQNVEQENETAIDPDAVVIDVSGKNFEFDVKEIRVQEGDTVVINFTSTDGFHDWVIAAFDAATDRVRPGETSSVTFVADQKGTYEYYCSVGTHRQQGMVGTLIVE